MTLLCVRAHTVIMFKTARILLSKLDYYLNQKLLVTCTSITMKNRKKITIKMRLLSLAETTTIKIRLPFKSDSRLPSTSNSYSNQKPLCTRILWWLLFKSETENAVKRDKTSKSDKAYRCFALTLQKTWKLRWSAQWLREISERKRTYISISKKTCIYARKISRNTDGLLSN